MIFAISNVPTDISLQIPIASLLANLPMVSLHQTVGLIILQCQARICSARQLEQKKDNQFRRGAMTKGNISTVLGGSQRSHGQNFTGMVLPQRRDVPLCSSHQISNFWSRWSLFPVKSAMVHNLLVVVYTTSPDTHTFNVQPRPFADLKLIE